MSDLLGRPRVALFSGGARTQAIAAELVADFLRDPVMTLHTERAAALAALDAGADDAWSVAIDARVAPDERLKNLLGSRRERVRLRAESFDGSPGDGDAGLAWFGHKYDGDRSPDDAVVVGLWLVDDGRSAERAPGGVDIHSYGGGYGGFAGAARGLMDGLERAGRQVRWLPYVDAEPPAPIGDAAIARLHGRCTASIGAQRTIYFREVSDVSGRPLLEPWLRAFHRQPTAVMTMFETDAIPSRWVAPLCEVERVWVPCTQNVRAFSDSGIDEAKIDLVPLAVDVASIDLDGPTLDLFGRRRVVFLSVFNWHLRKGPDLLLRGYAEAFDPEDDVCLALRIRTSGGSAEAVVAQELARLGLRRERMAPLMFVDMLSQTELAALYRSVDAFVLPTRGEGFGLPFLEAMAAGLPVIGPAYAGTADFLDERRAFVVPHRVRPVTSAAAREIPYFRGQTWAEPDVNALVGALRSVAGDLGAARRRAARGAAVARTRFNAVRIGYVAAAALDRLGTSFRVGRPRASLSHGCVALDADLGACNPDGASGRDLVAALERAGVRVAGSASVAPAAAPRLHYADAQRVRVATETPMSAGAATLRLPAFCRGDDHRNAVVVLADPARWLAPRAVEELATARAVWVPSAHAERRLRMSGFAGSIEVIPPPLDAGWYSPSCGGDDLWPTCSLRVLVLGDLTGGNDRWSAVAGCLMGLGAQDDAVIALLETQAGAARDTAISNLRSRIAELVPAANLARAASVVLLSAAPDEDARIRRIAGADLVVAPCGTPPRSLLEALATGTPLIAAEDDLAYAGIPSEVAYSVVAPERDNASFVSACGIGIRHLADHIEVRSGLAHRGRAHVVARHGLRTSGEAAREALDLVDVQAFTPHERDDLTAFVVGCDATAASETVASLERYASRVLAVAVVAPDGIRDALSACVSRFALVLAAGIRCTPAVDAILVAAIAGHEHVGAALPTRTAGGEPARLDAVAASLRDPRALERHAVARAFQLEGRGAWTASADGTAVAYDLDACRAFLASAKSSTELCLAISAAGLGVLYAADALVIG